MPVTTSRTNHRLSTPSAASASDCQTPGQIRMAIDSVLEYEVDDTSEFVFQIHVSDMPGQTLIVESLLVEPHMPYRCYTDTASGNRFLRLQEAAGTAVVVNEFGEIGLDHLLVAKASDAARPFAFDRGAPIELEPEFQKEIHRRVEVLNDNSHIVHPLDCHDVCLLGAALGYGSSCR